MLPSRSFAKTSVERSDPPTLHSVSVVFGSHHRRGACVLTLGTCTPEGLLLICQLRGNDSCLVPRSHQDGAVSVSYMVLGAVAAGSAVGVIMAATLVVVLLKPEAIEYLKPCVRIVSSPEPPAPLHGVSYLLRLWARVTMRNKPMCDKGLK